MDPTMQALYELFDGLAVLGPGNDETTREVLRRLPCLPERPRILDIGCGAGRSALVLAEACPNAEIHAIDTHQPYLDALAATAQQRGLRVRTRCESMDRLTDAPQSVDLIWSEGAAYQMGFEAALRAWRTLLKPCAGAAVSELCWLTEDRPEEARAFWAEEYPDMVGVDETRARARRAGLDVLETMLLPPEAWAAYYEPLEARCAALDGRAGLALAAVIRQTRREIEIWRRFGASYGYVLLLLRR